MGMYDAAAAPWRRGSTSSKKLVAPLNFSLLPELLAKRGYHNEAIGKW